MVLHHSVDGLANPFVNLYIGSFEQLLTYA